MNKLASATVLIGLGAMSFTACGGSDDDGGSAAGFCASLVKLNDSGVDPDTDFDGAIAALKDLESNASGDLKDDVGAFIDVMNRVNEAPDDADFADFEEDITQMTESIESIQAYADENCEGLPADLFS